MKQRTSLTIDEHVRDAAEQAARERGLSLSGYVNQVLEAHLAGLPKKRFPRSTTLTTDEPKPLAAEHDRSLARARRGR